MYDILSKLFINSFIQGIGKTSGTLLTMFIGWQFFKVTHGYDDILYFFLENPIKKNLYIKESITKNPSVETETKNVVTNEVDNLSNSENEHEQQHEHEQEHEKINVEDVERDKQFKNLFDILNLR